MNIQISLSADNEIQSKSLDLFKKRGQVTHYDECRERDFGAMRFISL